MAKYMKITLEKRGISCIARLLEEDAPRTCAAIWEALPQGGPVYHAKYARNETSATSPSRRACSTVNSRKRRGYSNYRA